MMEIGFKINENNINNNNKKSVRRARLRTKKWGILKYLSAEISLEKPEIIRTEWRVLVVS